jgi:SAM-dependent methyltransferase
MLKFIYKRKFYRNFFVRKFIRVSRKLSEIPDYFKDKKICGCSLVKYVPSLYRETMGATGSQSTCYWVLDEMFKDAQFNESDRFIDVGCGKGRVLAFMIKQKYPCSITGIELNKDVADFTKNWASKYENIEVINGNAFELDFDNYDVLFLGRPFEKEFFIKFTDKIETDVRHRLKLYYWVDQQSGDHLNDRPGWNMQIRKSLFVRHGLFLSMSPQRYSIWTYTPENER